MSRYESRDHEITSHILIISLYIIYSIDIVQLYCLFYCIVYLIFLFTCDIVLRCQSFLLSMSKTNKTVGFTLLVVLSVLVSHFGERLNLLAGQ